MRRKKCIECYREEIDATQSKVRRFLSSMSIPIPVGQRDRGREAPECSHCPSRGKTFYDPKGEDGELQASATATGGVIVAMFRSAIVLGGWTSDVWACLVLVT